MRLPKNRPTPRHLLFAAAYGLGLHALLLLDAYAVHALWTIVLAMYVLAGTVLVLRFLWRIYGPL